MLSVFIMCVLFMFSYDLVVMFLCFSFYVLTMFQLVFIGDKLGLYTNIKKCYNKRMFVFICIYLRIDTYKYTNSYI